MINNSNLTAMAQELEQAHQDAALLRRLNSAEECIRFLTPEYEKALAIHEEEVAAEIKAAAVAAQAAHEAQFAGLRDLHIIEVSDPQGSTVLSSRFRISWTRDAWDADANATLPQIVSMSGFAALPSLVLSWIVQHHPDKIPASIMALAPHDVDEALDRYFVALNRGYLVSQ